MFQAIYCGIHNQVVDVTKAKGEKQRSVLSDSGTIELFSEQMLTRNRRSSHFLASNGVRYPPRQAVQKDLRLAHTHIHFVIASRLV